MLQQLQNLLAASQTGALPPKRDAVPAPSDPTGILQQLQSLVKVLQSAGASPGDPISLIERLMSILPKAQATASGANATATGQLSVDQMKQAIDLLTTILSKAGTPALGQVNGALGETIGNLLNGKKTAIGLGGGLLTALLHAVPWAADAGGLSGLLVLLHEEDG